MSTANAFPADIMLQIVQVLQPVYELYKSSQLSVDDLESELRSSIYGLFGRYVPATRMEEFINSTSNEFDTLITAFVQQQREGQNT